MTGDAMDDGIRTTGVKGTFPNNPVCGRPTKARPEAFGFHFAS